MIKKEIFFDQISYVILVLLPFSLITGPFISDLSISTIAIIFLTKCIVQKNFNYLIIFTLNIFIFLFSLFNQFFNFRL